MLEKIFPSFENFIVEMNCVGAMLYDFVISEL